MVRAAKPLTSYSNCPELQNHQPTGHPDTSTNRCSKGGFLRWRCAGYSSQRIGSDHTYSYGGQKPYCIGRPHFSEPGEPNPGAAESMGHAKDVFPPGKASSHRWRIKSNRRRHQHPGGAVELSGKGMLTGWTFQFNLRSRAILRSALNVGLINQPALTISCPHNLTLLRIRQVDGSARHRERWRSAKPNRPFQTLGSHKRQ